MQCSIPPVYDDEFELAVAKGNIEVNLREYLNCQSSALVNGRFTAVSNNPPQFIQAHLRDRPRNVLLDHKLVTEALVEQVEELVRREKELEQLNACSNSSITTTGSGWSSTGPVPFESRATSEVSTGRAFSVFAPTEITTVSGVTEVAGNAKKRNKSVPKPSTKRSLKPHLMGGNDFELREDMRKCIQKAVASTVHTSTTTEPCISPLALLEPCVLVDTQVSNTRLSLVVDDEMLVLRLKMPNLRCYSYYKMHLSRWKPHNPLSLAIENGIETTNLTPICANKTAIPVLGTLSDDSSTSHNSDLDFGTSPLSHPVRLLVTNSVFLDLAITGSLGLAENKRRPKAAYIDRKLLKRPDQYIVLLNRRSGIPIAVCALKTPCRGPPVVRIFTTKRRHFAQPKAATTQQLGLTWWEESLPLYPWAEIVTEGAYPEKVRYSIYQTTGPQGEFEEEPSYRAIHSYPGSPKIRVVGRTERETTHAGCAILSMCQSKGIDEVFMQVSIARGVDPVLFICFAAFIDEAMEKTMRTEYNKT